MTDLFACFHCPILEYDIFLHMSQLCTLQPHLFSSTLIFPLGINPCSFSIYHDRSVCMLSLSNFGIRYFLHMSQLSTLQPHLFSSTLIFPLRINPCSFSIYHDRSVCMLSLSNFGIRYFLQMSLSYPTPRDAHVSYTGQKIKFPICPVCKKFDTSLMVLCRG